MGLPTSTDAPRTHGRFRAVPEDFQVDELPAYEPEGDGEHCYVLIRKRGLTTQEATKRLARALGADPREAGHAGLKDRHAVTTQWLSFLGATPEAASALELEDLQVVEARRHRHKLRPGKLRGNRFSLVVREVDPADHEGLRARLDLVARRGVPAFFGSQRFGWQGKNLEKAHRWLVEGGRAPRDRFERKMLVSSLQSEAFNRVLARRLQAGTFVTVLAGDLLRREDSGGVFASENPAEEQRRVDAFEISPTGPLPGPKSWVPDGAVGALERAVTEELGLTDEVLDRLGKLGPGSRRPLRWQLGEPSLEVAEDHVQLHFSLPAGAYATEVLRELFADGLVEGPAERSPEAPNEAETEADDEAE
ncbi:MAG: tRNA pseudouridine(13) synthase TruD [Sandaracinus sp.]|nr:tRNA pseudouridine(13) synthase TruD [Sandaracinus sp.]